MWYCHAFIGLLATILNCLVESTLRNRESGCNNGGQKTLNLGLGCPPDPPLSCVSVGRAFIYVKEPFDLFCFLPSAAR